MNFLGKKIEAGFYQRSIFSIMALATNQTNHKPLSLNEPAVADRNYLKAGSPFETGMGRMVAINAFILNAADDVIKFPETGTVRASYNAFLSHAVVDLKLNQETVHKFLLSDIIPMVPHAREFTNGTGVNHAVLDSFPTSIFNRKSRNMALWFTPPLDSGVNAEWDMTVNYPAISADLNTFRLHWHFLLEEIPDRKISGSRDAK
jgi:hypothetical protein